MTKNKQILQRKILRYDSPICSIWYYYLGKCLRNHSKKLKPLQTNAVKIIAGGHHCTLMIQQYNKQLNNLKIEDLYTLEVAKLMHKISRNKLPNRFSSFLLE